MNKHSLSIIIPARNEEANISNCLDSLVNQTYKDFSVLVINDQSVDRTEEIVREYANKYKNIKFLTISEKPENWVGKNYALYLAQKQVATELILFLDADVILSKDCIEKSCKIFNENNLDILSYAAHQDCKTLFEYSLQPLIFFILNLLYPLQKVSNSESDIAACNGIFILLKRETYNKIGTHEALKEEVLEDVELAKRAKKINARLLFVFKPELISVRMYKSLDEIVEGWSKNFFALLDYSVAKTISLLALLSIIVYIPIAILMIFPLVSQYVFIWFLLELTFFSYIYHKMGYKCIIGIFYPVGGLILPVIIMLSLINYKIKGSVKWKDRLYILKKRT